MTYKQQNVNMITEDQIADQSRFIHELTVTVENVTVTRNYASGNRAFQLTIGYLEVLTSIHMKDNGETYTKCKGKRKNILRYMSIQYTVNFD